MDKRNLIFFLYAIAIIASLITQSWVKVCDDLTQYLPETTETRRGLTLMEDEMKTYGTARIIVSHVTYEIARDLAGSDRRSEQHLLRGLLGRGQVGG